MGRTSKVKFRAGDSNEAETGENEESECLLREQRDARADSQDGYTASQGGPPASIPSSESHNHSPRSMKTQYSQLAPKTAPPDQGHSKPPPPQNGRRPDQMPFQSRQPDDQPTERVQGQPGS